MSGNYEFIAPSITIEATNAAGHTVRRELPVSYVENAYAMALRGDNAMGESQEIIFFTDAGKALLMEAVIRDHNAEAAGVKGGEGMTDA